jgi:hypothetical protein
MTIQELKDYMEQNIPTFINIRLLKSGDAFHYTNHYEKIDSFGGFKGQPITPDLDKTQMTIPSKPATDVDGVVFGYLNLKDAQEEGFGCDIIKVTFKQAIIATHCQEATLDAPDTVMILCADILAFEKL